MNTEKQNNDERFTVVELANGGIAVYDEEAPGKMDEVCIFWKGAHPNAKQAAESECIILNAWHEVNGQIGQPRRVERPPVGIVKGQFSKPSPEFLTVAEKRRYLAEIFRSPEFTDCDKFRALQEDNRMLDMFGPWNGKEQA